MGPNSATATEASDENAQVGRRGAVRRLMLLAGAAFVGGAVLKAEPAGATTGAMQFGASNDQGSAVTALFASTSPPMLQLLNSTGEGLTIQAPNRVLIATQNGTAGTGPTAWIANDAIAGDCLLVEAFGAGAAINVTRSNSVVAGATVDAKVTLSGPVYRATSTAPGNSEPLFNGKHQGLGAGVEAALTRATNVNAAIEGSTVGTGHAVHGAINNVASTNSAIRGDTNGLGSAVGGNGGNHGRGGTFTSHVAQVRLLPDTGNTHPLSGEVGDLYVDKYAHLWFCKGGKTWTKLA